MYINKNVIETLLVNQIGTGIYYKNNRQIQTIILWLQWNSPGNSETENRSRNCQRRPSLPYSELATETLKLRKWLPVFPSTFIPLILIIIPSPFPLSFTSSFFLHFSFYTRTEVFLPYVILFFTLVIFFFSTLLMFLDYQIQSPICTYSRKYVLE